MTTSGTDEKSYRLLTQDTDHIMTTLTLTYGWLRCGTGLTRNEATGIYSSVVPVGIGCKDPRVPELDLDGCVQCPNMDRYVTTPTWYKGPCAVPWNIAADDCSGTERSNTGEALTMGNGTQSGQKIGTDEETAQEESTPGGTLYKGTGHKRGCTRRRHMHLRCGPGGRNVAEKEIWEDPTYVGHELTSEGRYNRKISHMEKETALLRSSISTG